MNATLTPNLFQSAAKLALAAMLGVSLLGGGVSFAREGTFDRLLSKPAVKQGAIGAGVGALGGVLSDRVGVGRGAATGAVVGVGTGLLTQSRYLKDKPLVRNAAQGAVIGTGVNYARRSNKLEGAAVGAAGGVGYHYIKKYLDERR